MKRPNGKAKRLWVMDRGIPTEAILAEMRDPTRQMSYLVGTLKHRVQAYAPGLTPTAVLDQLATIQMVDVCIPTVDDRWLIMPRYTQPDPDTQLLLHHLHLELPAQPPPRITGAPALPVWKQASAQ